MNSQPGLFGATVIDVDINTGNMSNDLPVWLRDVLSRALTANGIHTQRKSASDGAIESLEEVDMESLGDKDCPICFDPYDKIRSELGAKGPQKEKKINKSDGLMEEDSELHAHLKAHHQVNYQPLEVQAQFNDPSLFLPTDEGGILHSRFPIQNLATRQDVSIEQSFPDLDDDEKAKLHRKSSENVHLPVRMPGCNHIFGKSCIVEWLKSNVSCPLCRKEVEASESDPKTKRARTIRDSTLHNFNDRDTSLQHLISDSTDYYNPFRRPFNPAITPLTDSFMHQDWVHPQPARLSEREPNLILLQHTTEPVFHAIPLRRTNPIPATLPAQIPTQGSTSRPRSVSSNSSRSRVHFWPHTTTIDALNRSDGSDDDEIDEIGPRSETENNNSINRERTNNSDSPRGGGGGPERSRGSSRNNNRTHPYSRPSSADI